MKSFKITFAFFLMLFMLAVSTVQAQTPRRMSGKSRGTLIGAGAGAVGGAVVGGTKGAIIGAGVGAVGGRVLGKRHDRRRATRVR